MDDELKGEGNSLNYTFRMHDPRVGRFFARDPLEPTYPFYSPYQFSGNRVIDMVELEGLEPSKPPKSEDGSIYLYRFNLGNSDPEFQDYMGSFSQTDFHNIRSQIYEGKMSAYNNNFSKAMYGTDSNGEIAIPEYIREREWEASSNEVYGAIKDAGQNKSLALIQVIYGGTHSQTLYGKARELEL